MALARLSPYPVEVWNVFPRKAVLVVALVISFVAFIFPNTWKWQNVSAVDVPNQVLAPLVVIFLTIIIEKTWSRLKRLIRRASGWHPTGGPGQEVGTLPQESLAGREQIEKNLKRMREFLDDDEARYLGIYGMGGVGKTTLLKIFYDEQVGSYAKRRFDHIIFITLSRSPNIEEIEKDIKNQIDGNLSSLRKSEVLLLLDDVWEEVDLTRIGIPIPSIENKCKVIMTGRSKDFCRIKDVLPEYGMRSFEVSTLTKSEAWIFFQKKVGNNLDSKGGEIAKLAKKVARRCDGLPLALGTVGSSMIGATVEHWREAEKTLRDFPPVKDKLLKLLRFSFDKLNDDNIKNCLLYCCLFKEDKWIGKDELIDYWFAEGFLDSDHAGCSCGARDRGRRNITTLVSCSLLQEASNNACVRMHDVVREMCLWITSGEFHQYREFYVYHEKDPNCTSCTMALKNIQRLSIFMKYHAPYQDGKYFPREINLSKDSNPFPNLQTLLCDGTPIRIPIEKIFFQNCENLRVLQLRHCVWNFELNPLFLQQLRHLDLSYTNLGKLPQNIDSLHNLVHLILVHNDGLKILPDSIGKLKNLQFLNMSFTAIKSLPSSIGNLINLKRLYLRGTKLESLPDSIGALIKLQELNLSSAKILTLPDSIEKLTHLKALDLSGSDVKYLPSSIGNLVNLGRLDLSYSELESLPHSIGALTKLQKLNLSRTTISTLPNSIGKLTHLKELNLSWSEVKSFPSSIGNLVNLERFYIRGSKFESLPDSIGALIKLQELNLCRTTISTLPNSIGKLTHLKALYLSWSALKSLPSSIVNLINLESLNLFNSELESLPNSIGALIKLQELNLCRTKISTLPDSIGKLTHLKALDLSWSALKSLPSSIGNLSNLERLDLSNSKLESLIDSIGAIVKLQELNLSSTKISTLPDSIGKLTHLKALDLSGSDVKSLPSSIGNLFNLERLDLSNSKLESLLDSIGAIVKLQELNLSSTKISTLPDSIGKLTHLKALDLSWSALKSLPSSIGNLSNLERLDLSNSKLESLLDSIGALIKLQELNLSSTKISTLPDSIGKLTHLKALDLSGSDVKSLPSSIGNLFNLERLDLSNSKLESLLDSIGALIKLQELNLSSTKISTLPDSIGKLTNLKALDLSWSEVKSLPCSIGYLVNLKSLNLFGSELERLPDSISALIKLQELNLSRTKNLNPSK